MVGASDENVRNNGSSEKEVAAAVIQLNDAIVHAEKTRLEDIASENLTYGHSCGLVQNKAEFVDDLLNGYFDFDSVSDQTIHIAGEIAVVRHIFSADATNAGEPEKVKTGNLLVFQQESNQWKLLTRQAYKL